MVEWDAEDIKTKRVSMIGEAFTHTTNSRHARTLKELSDFVLKQRSMSSPTTAVKRGQNVGTVLPTEVEDYLWHRKLFPYGRTKSGELKWSSLRTIYGTMLGAVKAARLHQVDIRIDETDPSWKRIDRYITKKVFSEAVNFPKAMSYAEAEQVMQRLNGPLKRWLRQYFLLWWITAARPGDAALLKWDNIMLNGNTVSVKFVEGKGVTIRGPYTVHTFCPDVWMEDLLNAHRASLVVPTLIREVIREQILKEMKKVNGLFEARSVRRGALQTLAMTGATDETLLSFSGHKSAAMLYRYLDWGSRRYKGRVEGHEAGRAAWGKSENVGKE
jgi:integrase